MRNDVFYHHFFFKRFIILKITELTVDAIIELIAGNGGLLPPAEGSVYIKVGYIFMNFLRQRLYFFSPFSHFAHHKKNTTSTKARVAHFQQIFSFNPVL